METVKGKILFVDDEENILRSLKRNFLTSGLTIFTTDVPAKGLEIIDKEKIDIVVSDVKMPNMNGIEFLTLVKKWYPGVNRVILSGYVERELVLQAIMSGVAFDYFTKPWDNQVLLTKIKHIMNIRTMLKNEEIKIMLNSIDELPKIPKVAKQFSEAVARGDDLKAISDIISKDISISAKVLQIVNSAFYSGERISSISRAVSIMGLTSLKNIVLSAAFSMEESLPKLQTDFIIDTANRMLRTNKIFLKIYGLKYGLPVPEDYAAIGLVFNIGKIIIAKYFPERFNKILAEMKNKKVDFLTAELNLGYKDATHCEIGGYFLELWNFSKENIESSLFHHIPDLCPQDISKIMKMLQKACEHEKTLTDEQLDKIMATEKL